MGYYCIKQQLKHLSKEDYCSLKELSHTAKNLYNQGLYNVRQCYLYTGEYLSYQPNYRLLKNSDNYKLLNSNMAQQILKRVDRDFHSFFSLLSKKEPGQKVHIPNYLDKDGYATLIIGFVRVNKDEFVVPYSNQYRKNHAPIKIKLPQVVVGKAIKEIRIVPISNARFFEVQYVYEDKDYKEDLNLENALAIDLGIDNLCTCVTNTGDTFILDGRRLKSVNQWYNKENARLQSIKDKQKHKSNTARQAYLLKRRNNVVNDILNKSVRYIVDYCLMHDIGQVVIGYNKDIQKNSNIGKANNQNFVNIPIGLLRKKLSSLCQRYGIVFTMQEESYTSKASFFDGDSIPVYGEKASINFSGKRVKRGLYRSKNGYEYNADVNGALNILAKSKVVCLETLYNRGVVATPMRIRIA